MLLIHQLSELPKINQERPTVLTVGVFDGVHIAHQKILLELTTRAKQYTEGQTVIFTFEEHPLKVLKPEIAPPLLLHTEEKNKLIGEQGIDVLVNEKFTQEFAQTPPDKFIREEVCKYLNLKEIVVGHDHGFGKNASGNVELLKALGKEYSFTVDEMEPIQINRKTISSSYIRELLLSGEVAEASKLLGRPHSIIGTVVEGFRRGRTLGFPTANLQTEHEVVPGRAVYAVKVELQGTNYPGIMNIGQRPSFPDAGPSVEVHLLNFDGNIYGKVLKIYFIQKIREEKKFASVDTLKAQIHQDELEAKSIFQVR